MSTSGGKRAADGTRADPASPDRLPSLADQGWLRDPRAQAVFSALEAGGHEGRAVGGCVRNALMGTPVNDVDIATTATPEETIALARAAGLSPHPTGLAHGTITVVAGHHPYEVTTLRRDVETFGRHATVAYTTSWKEDAERRDFTMNALYCDRGGNIHDPLGGYPDLAARRVRFIGDPHARIREDYLRILRFFRFFATYGAGAVDAEGLAAAVEEQGGLDTLSAERIRGEIVRLLVAPRALEAVAVMVGCGIAGRVLGTRPEVAVMSRLVAIEAGLARQPDPILRLSALAAHDPADARKLAQRLKVSNAERDLLKAASPAAPPVSRDTGMEHARVALYRCGGKAYVAGALLAWARGQAAVDDPVWRRLVQLPDRWDVPTLPVRGADVLALGVPPGPKVASVLRRFEDWWVGEGFPDDKSLIAARLAAIVSE